MQGRNENLLTATDKVRGFQEKVRLWRSKITDQNLTMFPLTAARNIDAHMTSLILDSLIMLEDQIEKYFPDIDVKNYDWVRDPFHVSITELTGLQRPKEEDLCSLKND